MHHAVAKLARGLCAALPVAAAAAHSPGVAGGLHGGPTIPASQPSCSIDSKHHAEKYTPRRHARTCAIGGLLVEAVPLHLAAAHIGADKVAAVAQEHAVADCTTEVVTNVVLL